MNEKFWNYMLYFAVALAFGAAFLDFEMTFDDQATNQLSQETTK